MPRDEHSYGPFIAVRFDLAKYHVTDFQVVKYYCVMDKENGRVD